MAAAGKVCTGFAKPYVALYSNTGATPAYSGGMQLARGVDVSIEPEVGDTNPFYADNVEAETVPGTFTGGTVTLTVDGLLEAAEKLIFGLPEPEELTYDTNKTAKVTTYGDSMKIPYMGLGFIVRYMSDGVESYSTVMLTKVRFQTPTQSAATQEEQIDWQTQELTADLMRDDSASHAWKKVAADVSTEAEAEAILKAMLNITEGP